MNLPPLLAADILETIIGSLFVILWLVAQFLGSRQEANRKKKPPRPRPQQPRPIELAEAQPKPGQQRPRNPAPPNPGPRNQEEALRSEVEDFLRRAQGQPEQPRPAPQQKPPRRQSPPTAPVTAPVPVASAAPRTLRSEGVAEHVARHLSTEEIAEHTRTLGAKVAQSDDRLESHLQEKFDHNLGTLAHGDITADERPEDDDVAAQIAAMLAKPEGMRQLIVANEILRRPEW